MFIGVEAHPGPDPLGVVGGDGLDEGVGPAERCINPDSTDTLSGHQFDEFAVTI
jgi:hypothetical protein